MAKVDVIMPQMGESIAEGTLTRWLKKVGEPVERDEDLFEISTDKVDADIPAPGSGILSEILVQEGETVEVNTIVARIDTEAEAGAAVATAEVPAGVAEETVQEGSAPAVPLQEKGPPAVPAPEAATPSESLPEQPPAVAAEAPRAGAVPTESSSRDIPDKSGGTEPATREERLHTRSTPLVRKIAAEHGVDISRVEGTGIAGRVTRDDIMSFLEAREGEAVAVATASSQAPAPVVGPEPASPGAPPQPARPPVAQPPTPLTAQPAAPAPAPEQASVPGLMRVPIHGATLEIRIPRVPVRENDQVEEMNRVRLRTMEHMLMSQRISAHVTSVTEVDFERVVRLRQRMKPKFAEQGVKLTYGPFIMKAVVEGLLEYPILNTSVDGTRIVYHGDINLGIAVAVNDGKELIVPVLKNADKLSLIGLAQGANSLAEKARTKTLDFDDIQGGSFTITNVGVFGNLFGTPIINQPQVAILGTGVIEKRPVVVEDAMGNDAIGIRHMSYFGLSYDHRVVDGAMAAFFLNKVQEVLENFPEDSV